MKQDLIHWTQGENKLSDIEKSNNENNGWYQDTNGKWHYKYREHDIKDRIIDIDGNIYNFDKNGVILTDDGQCF